MIDALPMLASLPGGLPEPPAGAAAPGFAALFAAALPAVVAIPVSAPAAPPAGVPVPEWPASPVAPGPMPATPLVRAALPGGDERLPNRVALLTGPASVATAPVLPAPLMPALPAGTLQPLAANILQPLAADPSPPAPDDSAVPDAETRETLAGPMLPYGPDSNAAPPAPAAVAIVTAASRRATGDLVPRDAPVSRHLPVAIATRPLAIGVPAAAQTPGTPPNARTEPAETIPGRPPAATLMAPATPVQPVETRVPPRASPPQDHLPDASTGPGAPLPGASPRLAAAVLALDEPRDDAAAPTAAPSPLAALPVALPVPAATPAPPPAADATAASTNGRAAPVASAGAAAAVAVRRQMAAAPAPAPLRELSFAVPAMPPRAEAAIAATPAMRVPAGFAPAAPAAPSLLPVRDSALDDRPIPRRASRRPCWPLNPPSPGRRRRPGCCRTVRYRRVGCECRRPASPRHRHTVGSRQQHAAGSRQQHAAGSRQQHTAGPRQQHTAGSRQQHSAGPRQQHTAGPRYRCHPAGRPCTRCGCAGRHTCRCASGRDGAGHGLGARRAPRPCRAAARR